MSLSVGGEEFLHIRIQSIAVVSTCLLCHTDAAVGLQGTLKRGIGLKAYNSFFGFIKISGTMGRNGGNDFGIHIQDTAGFSFLTAQIQNLIPKLQGILCRSGKKSFISVIRVVILLDKIAHIDFVLPVTAYKTIPFCSQDFPPLLLPGQYQM